MVIVTTTTLALRCPSCGKLGYFTLSRFALRNGAKKTLTCECGHNMAAVQNKNRTSFMLRVECMLCEKDHLYTYKSTGVWKRELKTVLCDEAGMEIGYIGPGELVRESVQRLERSMREMAEDMGYDKYFINPDVMYEVLDILKKMTEDGRLSCGCGVPDLEVEAFPDRIELYCNSCDAIGVISAETAEDLQWLKKNNKIVLEEQKQVHFNPGWTFKRRRFNKKTT